MYELTSIDSYITKLSGHTGEINKVYNPFYVNIIIDI